MGGSRRGSKGERPKGRVTAYAFFVQSQNKEEGKGGKRLSFGEQSKKCGEMWKAMSKAERMPFMELQDRDRQRYDLEMKDYESKEKGKNKVKDSNSPKRVQTGFFRFSNDERKKVKEAHPEFGAAEVAKELGRMWKEMSPASKEKYQVMATRDQKEIEAYNTRSARALTTVQMEESDDDEVVEIEEDESD